MSFETDEEARRHASHLIAVGIEVRVEAGGASPFQGIPALSGATLLVLAADVERAREALRGAKEGPSPVAGERRCTECGEWSPASFEACWQCDHDLTAIPVTAARAAAIDAEKEKPRAPAFKSRLDRRTLAMELGAVLLATWLPQVVWVFSIRLSAAPITHRDVVWSLLSGAGLVALLVYLLWRDSDWDENLGVASLRWMREFLWGAVFFLGLFPAYMVVQFLAWALLGGPAAMGGADPYVELIKSPAMLALWFASGAIVEEVFFRGYLLPRLVLLLRSRILALLVSSALFALSHGYGLVGTVGTFFFGMVMGAGFLLQRRLPRLILAHFAVNMFLSLTW